MGGAEDGGQGFDEHATLLMTDIDHFSYELVQYGNNLKKSLMEKR